MPGDDPAHWARSPWTQVILTQGVMKPRYNAGVSLLSDGNMLIVGGDSVHNVSSEILIFDPKKRTI